MADFRGVSGDFILQVRTEHRDSAHYIWDAERLDSVRTQLFDPEWWRGQERLEGRARGRGEAYFLDARDGAWVLRHYRRGGLAARLVEDHYLWLGAEHSRAFREWRLLARLRACELPVPAPVAAVVCRIGVIYSADLITERVPNARPLTEWLNGMPLPARDWQALGKLLARFHAAGVYHHDLNAHNILLDQAGGFTLIDFDKGRLRNPGSWRKRNLQRLRRSLDKLSNDPSFCFAQADWLALIGGYSAALA